VVDQIVHHQRRGALARTLSTDVGRSNPHFDAQQFSPYPVSGGPAFTRAGMVGRFNLALGYFADRGDIIRCIKTAAQMKTQGVKPNVLTYNYLIRACEKDALSRHASAIYEDMLSMGLQPERETFHSLFKVSLLARINSGVIADEVQVHSQESLSVVLGLWSKMLEGKITPNATSYEILITHLTKEGNLEMALSTLTEMEKRDLSPSTETAESIILLATKRGNPRLALDLATSYEDVSVRPLSTTVWIHILASCAEYLFVSQMSNVIGVRIDRSVREKVLTSRGARP